RRGPVGKRADRGRPDAVARRGRGGGRSRRSCLRAAADPGRLARLRGWAPATRTRIPGTKTRCPANWTKAHLRERYRRGTPRTAADPGDIMVPPAAGTP